MVSTADGWSRAKRSRNWASKRSSIRDRSAHPGPPAC
jgi:hypothetical protein